MQSKIIAVGNLKGGTGKTTLAVNLASALAVSGVGPVCLVDADEQGSAVEWAKRGRLPMPVEALPFEHETSGDNSAELAWLERLNGLAADNAMIVVDLPPHLGRSIVLALVAADLLMNPVTPSGADLKATTRALDLLRQARDVRGEGKPACLMVPSRVDRRTAAGKEIDAVLHDFGEPVAPAISQRAAHVDAFTSGDWIGRYAARSTAHDEILSIAAITKRIRA